MDANIIVAHNKDGVIGLNGKIPWHLPSDLRRFKEITSGHPIVMGRKTADSLKNALPNRRNVVMSRSPYARPDFECATGVEEAVNLLGEELFFVIGGEQIYKLFLPLCNKIYRSVVDADVKGDTFFPQIDETEWELAREIKEIFYPASEKRVKTLSFQVLKKLSSRVTVL